MTTLLQIYESYHNGQKKQFADQILDYGAAEFAADTVPEIAEGILSTQEAYNMLKTFIIVNEGD